MTWANRLTLLRVLLIPVFLLFMYLNIPGGLLWAAVVFFVASMTDILDGYLARRDKTVTVFGKVFDPIADKLIVLAALTVFLEKDMMSLSQTWALQPPLPSIITIVLVGREILIGGFRIVMAEKGEVVSASWLGKTKTTLQDVAIILLLLANCGIGFFGFLDTLYLWQISMCGAVLFSIWSAVDYLKGNLKNITGGL